MVLGEGGDCPQVLSFGAGLVHLMVSFDDVAQVLQNLAALLAGFKAYDLQSETDFFAVGGGQDVADLDIEY